MIEQNALMKSLAPGMLGAGRSQHADMITEEGIFPDDPYRINQSLLEPRRMQGLSEQPTLLRAEQQRFLRPQTSPDFAVFAKNGNEVIINEQGAFVPIGLFGGNPNLQYEVANSPDGTATVRIFAHPPIENRPQFGSARGLIIISDDFDAPLEDFAEYME